jgi:hypothetical protein
MQYLHNSLGHGVDASLRLGSRAEHVIESAPVPGLQRYVALELERYWDLVCSYRPPDWQVACLGETRRRIADLDRKLDWQWWSLLLEEG